MARNTNTVILVGHLGSDPEVRQFQNGGQITEINKAIQLNAPIGYPLWCTAILPMWQDNIYKKAQKSA